MFCIITYVIKGVSRSSATKEEGSACGKDGGVKMNRERVVVGLSGGVDSAAAAYLLKKQGYEVTGVTMCVLGEENRGAQEQMLSDAAAVAEALGIRHETVDFTKSFREKVEEYFAREYLSGRTPNPCLMCNRYVKWEAVLGFAKSVGAGWMATGHYARIERLSNGRYAVRNSVTAEKDQTYVLARLTQEQLAHTLMPLGTYTKEQVRELAKEAGIPVAQKKDSQEICFIPDHDYAAFIARRRPEDMCSEGNFVTPDGVVLGRHRGLVHYTVGQRKSLGIALGQRMFVKCLRPETNEVVLVPDDAVYSHVLVCKDISFMGIMPMQAGEKRRLTGRIRYGHKGAAAAVTMMADGCLKAEFEQPVRAVTPGQAAVFYDGEYLACSGIISD